MSSGNQQYAALAKAAEAAEQEVVHRRRKVEEVTAARRLVAEEWLGRIELRRKRLEELARVDLVQALLVGDTSKVTSIKSYEKRLKADLEELEQKYEVHRVDYERAVDRLRLADEELLAARIERKKIEQLMSRRRSREELLAAAREDALGDEMNQFRRR